MYIPTANDVRNNTFGRKERFEKAVEYQTNLITKASENGYCHCIWIFYGNTRYEDFELEAERLFKNAGYNIRWTGIVGGVRQDCKDICW